MKDTDSTLESTKSTHTEKLKSKNLFHKKLEPLQIKENAEGFY